MVISPLILGGTGMSNFLKKATPSYETTRAEKIKQGIASQEERNESVNQDQKHKKTDFNLGTFSLSFKRFLKSIIKFSAGLFRTSIILFALAHFVPLRDVLPSVYVWVDTILNCFENIFSFCNYFLSFFFG